MSDGDSVFSPVGNRISQFDLKRCVVSEGVHMSPRVLSRAAYCRNKSWTHPFENRTNISCFAVSPNGLLMISIDEGIIYLSM